jgi:RNA polymerase sigma factor (TIGR02999 family)
MSENVNQIFEQSLSGHATSTERLLELVYDQLREIAQRHLNRERPDHSLQPTALVHEAFLKLIDQRVRQWENAAHFRAIASNIMRRILVDHARARSAVKRGRDFNRVSISTSPLAGSPADNPYEIVALDDLLKKLEQLNSRHAKIVELRVFGGMNIEEVAGTLGVSPATVKNDWRAARAWLTLEMEKAQK